MLACPPTDTAATAASAIAAAMTAARTAARPAWAVGAGGTEAVPGGRMRNVGSMGDRQSGGALLALRRSLATRRGVRRDRDRRVGHRGRSGLSSTTFQLPSG